MQAICDFLLLLVGAVALFLFLNRIEKALTEFTGYEEAPGWLKIWLFIVLFAIMFLVEQTITDTILGILVPPTPQPRICVGLDCPPAPSGYRLDDGRVCIGSSALTCVASVETLLDNVISNADEFVARATSQVDDYSYCFRGEYVGTPDPTRQNTTIVVFVDFHEYILSHNTFMIAVATLVQAAKEGNEPEDATWTYLGELFEPKPLSTYMITNYEALTIGCRQWISRASE